MFNNLFKTPFRMFKTESYERIKPKAAGENNCRYVKIRHVEKLVNQSNKRGFRQIHQPISHVQLLSKSPAIFMLSHTVDRKGILRTVFQHDENCISSGKIEKYYRKNPYFRRRTDFSTISTPPTSATALYYILTYIHGAPAYA